MNRVRTVRLNPAGEPCGGRKPAAAVTDRALRYRANSDDCRPAPPERCWWCGDSRVEVAHIDGDESNTTPENLAWTCRSCNQRVAAVLRAAGIGRTTNQYNAAGRRRRKGATDWREFAQALGILDGSAIGDKDQAIALLKETPMSRRSEFQRDIWQVRKERYGPSGRKDGGSVPF